MGMTIDHTHICDRCSKPIPTGEGEKDFLTIEDHGLSFHMDCVMSMSALEMIDMVTDESTLNNDWDLRLRKPSSLIASKGSRRGLRFG